MSNLLPEQDKQAILRLYRKRLITVYALGISSVVLASIILLTPSLYLSKGIDTAVVQKRAELAGKETTGVQATLTKTIARINARLDVFNQAGPMSPIIGNFVDPVLAAKTDAIHLVNFTYSLDLEKKTLANIQVSGTASSRQALLDYGSALKKIPGVTNVVVPISSFIKDQDVPFIITATLTVK